MKTDGMLKQLEALDKMADTVWFALFMEQGTGKTWTFLADAERLYRKGKIDAVLVGAPSGVHENWVRREIPKHLEVAHGAHYWTPHPGKGRRAILQKGLLQRQDKLRILTVNFESIATSDEAFEFCMDFLQSSRALFILDESQRIKNPKSATYKRVHQLRPYAIARRIGTGTPMDKPQDIFSQMEFLKPGLLGTTNYRAFMAQYARLVDYKRTDPDYKGPELPSSDDFQMSKQIIQNPQMRYAIRVARDDITGRPIYRNLDKLRKLIEPHAFRCLKKECLDLPEKLYDRLPFHMTKQQREAYDLAETELRVRARDGTLTPFHKLGLFTKLQQITSGFVMVPGDPEPVYVEEKNPRLAAIMDRIQDFPGQKVIWCRFREEVAALARLMTAAGITFTEYHGGNKKTREAGLDAFSAGEYEVFLGVQKAGGTGLTILADTVFFCSNEYSAIVRDQAEDRSHRRGSVGQDIEVEGVLGKHVLYIDLVAVNSIDESIAEAYAEKKSLTEQILGDRDIDMSGVSEHSTMQDEQVAEWLGV